MERIGTRSKLENADRIGVPSSKSGEKCRFQRAEVARRPEIPL